MCDKLKINQACLMVESHFPAPLDLYSQSSECYGCPLQRTVRVPRLSNASAVVGAIHALQFEVRHHRLGDTLPNCSYSELLGDHGSYLLRVTSKGECHRETLEEPANIYNPLITAGAIFLVVVLVWQIARCCRRVRAAMGARNSSFESQENVLGSALSISGNAAEMEKPPLTPAKKRLRALDAFRGLSLVVMVFVNYGGGKYWFFHHSPWNGLTVADLVFPWFIWIMGVSMAMSVRSLLRKSVSKRRIMWKILKRSAILFFLGIVLNTAHHNNDLTKLRIPGVLQRFGISYLVACSLHLLFARPQDKMVGSGWTTKVRDILLYWPEWLVMLALLAVHLALTFFFNVPDCGRGYLGPGGLHLNGSHFNCTGGAAGYIDRTLLGGSHIYQAATPRLLYKSHQPYDPEGILGCLTSIFLVFLGLQAGKVLVTFKEWRPRLSRWCVWGVVCGIIGGVLCKFSKEDGWIPLNKNLWSVSYILAMASTAFLLLALFYYIIDVQGFWSGAPFTYAGMNSIAVYVGHDMVNGMFPWAWKCYETHWCYLFMNLWGTSLWVLAAFIMYRKGVFIAI
ncbi:heparan-alpha-glucosaminide N-acetyltransferase isoform X2 [Ixodes scapularis]|nr:heparan-alpha-glucosaminide N-acetyltransferase isoform X2 [Ixodes scapularis]XP_042148458.1 heparan-alpha-glucosaminide N-acetyltransferase isoform X2 [Ixodes scapularis]